MTYTLPQLFQNHWDGVTAGWMLYIEHVWPTDGVQIAALCQLSGRHGLAANHKAMETMTTLSCGLRASQNVSENKLVVDPIIDCKDLIACNSLLSLLHFWMLLEAQNPHCSNASFKWHLKGFCSHFSPYFGFGDHERAKATTMPRRCGPHKITSSNAAESVAEKNDATSDGKLGISRQVHGLTPGLTSCFNMCHKEKCRMLFQTQSTRRNFPKNYTSKLASYPFRTESKA